MTWDRQPPSGIDFTIATGIEDDGLLESLIEYFAGCESGGVSISRSDLSKELGIEISATDAECLFTGLVLNGVAEQEQGKGRFADYVFSIRPEPAVAVLREQAIARTAITQYTQSRQPSTGDEVELAATFPPHLGPPRDANVVSISAELRDLFFGATDIVRIANPYFDAGSTVVEDIASLAARGVEVRILTRETTVDADAAATINEIYTAVPSEYRELFEVRDLYERSESTGRQRFATHAKAAIADFDFCYIGSANLTETNLERNFEMGVLLKGEVMRDAIDVFDHVFASARQVKPPI